MKTFLFLLLMSLAQCAPAAAPAAAPRPTRAPMTAALAAEFALEAFRTENGVGHLVGAPAFLRGQVMSLADAHMLVNGRPLAEDSPLAYRRDRLVWLVVTRGEWLLHIPGAHGDPRNKTPTINAKDVTVSDLWNALIFDAVTGEPYEQGGISEAQRGFAEQLPRFDSPARSP